MMATESAPAQPDLDLVLEILRAYRPQQALMERDLQLAIARLLSDAGMRIRLEAKLSNGGRVDILTGTIVVEVKIRSWWSRAVWEQLKRYAEAEEVSAVVLATERGFWGAPTDLAGKPFVQVPIMQNWGMVT